MTVKRKRPMQRGKPLQRSPMKARSTRSAKSKGHLFAKGRCPEYLAYLRTRRCVVCSRKGWQQMTRTQAAHVRSRGAGGVDLGNAISLCGEHHHQQGFLGRVTFQELYGISMADEAARQTLAFLESGG